MRSAEQYGSGPFVEALCGHAGLSSRPELIRSNTNLIYDCGDSILRLTPNAFRPKEEVAAELNWLQFAGGHTDQVVQVIPGHDDALTSQFTSGGEEFTVTRLEKIDGKPIEQHQWQADHFEQVGALTGLLHRVGQLYAPAAEVDLKAWDEAPEMAFVEHLPDDGRELRRLSEAATAYMRAMERPAKTYGPIHYDIHAGNYLVTADGELRLLDFENSCRAHYVNDIAVALYYARLHKFSGDGDAFDDRFLVSFWKGYETQYAIPEGELHHIPWLLLNRGLIVYGYLMKLWPGEVTGEQAVYVERVEQSIERVRKRLGV